MFFFWKLIKRKLLLLLSDFTMFTFHFVNPSLHLRHSPCVRKLKEYFIRFYSSKNLKKPSPLHLRVYSVCVFLWRINNKPKDETLFFLFLFCRCVISLFVWSVEKKNQKNFNNQIQLGKWEEKYILMVMGHARIRTG